MDDAYGGAGLHGLVATRAIRIYAASGGVQEEALGVDRETGDISLAAAADGALARALVAHEIFFILR